MVRGLGSERNNLQNELTKSLSQHGFFTKGTQGDVDSFSSWSFEHWFFFFSELALTFSPFWIYHEKKGGVEEKG